MSGWPMVPIGDVCDVVGGGTPSRANEAFFGGAIPWATVRDMKSDWIESTEFSITEEASRQSATNILPSGTVVVASRVGLGKVCRVRYATAINQDLRGFLPKKRGRIDEQYLFHWFKSVAHRIVAAGTGATVQGVTLPFLRSLKIPLPPLDEQRRIVAVLDEALAAISTATANAEQNLTNARELFEAAFRERFDHLGNRWKTYRVPDIAENWDYLRRPVTKSARVPGDVPYYGASGQVDSVRDYLFDDELLLISEDGANLLMRTYPIAFSISGKAWVNNHAHILKFDDIATQRLVEYYFNSISVAPWVSGMAQPKLNQKALNNIPIPLPPLEDRERLVADLEELADQIEELKANQEARLASLADLRKSLLHRAFSGELTELEPLAA